MSRWTLADIIDLEAQLAWDRVQAHHQGGAAAGLDQRDRQIGAALGTVDDAGLLRGWVRALRERGDHLPGLRVMGAIGALRALASLVAMALGVGLASAVLRYDGTRPISILAAVGVLVLLPTLALALTLLLQLPGLRRAFALTGGPVPWLLGHAAAPWLRRALPPGPPGYHAALGANLLRRDGGRLVYGPVWRSALGELVQQLGLLAIAAALATVVLRVIFTDLAFAWGSTLQVDESWMRGFVDLLAAPWAWAWLAGVPDDALIAISRYNRLEGAFAGAGTARAPDAEALGRWWTFLVACLVCWALLPRLASTLAFARLRRRAVAAQDARSATLLDHREQVARLRDAGPRFRAGPGDRDPVPPPAVTDDSAWPGAEPALVVVWDECVEPEAAQALVLRRGGPVERVVTAGHGLDAAIDETAVAAVDAARPGPIALLVDGGEQPLAEVLAFLRDLRHAGGRRPLAVALLGADASNRARWRAATAALETTVLDWEEPA